MKSIMSIERIGAGFATCVHSACEKLFCWLNISYEMAARPRLNFTCELEFEIGTKVSFREQSLFTINNYPSLKPNCGDLCQGRIRS